MENAMEINKIEVRYSSEKRSHKSRIYIFHSKESILENLVNRRSRPIDQYREIMPQILKKYQEETGYMPEKVRWSQKAGCSCGCSPGFIVDAHYNREVFVTVTI